MRAVLSHFGGIVPRLADHMLAPTQATIAHDVLLRDGILQAWREPCEFAQTVANAKSFHLHGCCVYSWTEQVQVAELSPDWKRMYLTGRECGGLEMAVTNEKCEIEYLKPGVPAPPTAPSAAGYEQCSREADVRSYVYTWVNQWGEESAPSPPSNTVRVDDGSTVIVSGFAEPPEGFGIMAVNIYRAATGFRVMDGKIQKPLTDYFYVTTVPLPIEYYEDKLEAMYLGAVLETQYDRPPPDNLKGVIAIGDQIRLAAFNRNRLYFSEAHQPYNWPAKYELTFDYNIIHIGALDQRVFVTTEGTPYIVDVSSCDDTVCTPVTSVDVPLADIGRGHYHAAIMTHHGMFYPTQIGLVLLQPNGQWHIVTSRWFGEREWRKIKPDTIRLAYWEGFLFFATDMATFMLDIDGDPYGNARGSELVTLSDSPVDMVRSETGRLLFLQNDKIWVWDAGAKRRPYIWQSRQITQGGDAVGDSQLEADDPAFSCHWWPTVVKAGGNVNFSLLDGHGHVFYERPLLGRDKWRRLPRNGRHTAYQIKLTGVEPLDYINLGTMIFGVNHGV